MLIAAVLLPLRIRAFAERQDAAVLAEAVLDHVFVERVGGQSDSPRSSFIWSRGTNHSSEPRCEQMEQLQDRRR